MNIRFRTKNNLGINYFQRRMLAITQKTKKINDIIFAGVLFGIVDGLIFDCINMIVKIAGLKTSSPWEDVTNVFFDPPELHLLPARIFGFIMSFNGSITIAILLCLLVKLTGKNYIYVKSILVSHMVTFLNFAIFYPATGVTYYHHSLPSVYVAFLGMFLFGTILAFLAKRYFDCNFK